MINRTRSIAQFKKIRLLGKGTYGSVYHAIDTISQQEVAVKKVRLLQSQGLSTTSLREIQILDILKGHPNVLRLNCIALGDHSDSLFLIFDSLPYDLAKLMITSLKLNVELSWQEIKCLMLQILSAVTHVHALGVIHRDIKLNNFLLSQSGIVKLIDFGLARRSSSRPMTPNIVTLWERSPELLLGADKYGAEIDMWAVGCIFLQLANKGQSLMKGKDQKGQLAQIVKLIGYPEPGQFPQRLNEKLIFQVGERIQHSTKILESVRLTDKALSLIKGLLNWSPLKRLSAQQCLSHAFFKEEPQACASHELSIMRRLARQAN